MISLVYPAVDVEVAANGQVMDTVIEECEERFAIIACHENHHIMILIAKYKLAFAVSRYPSERLGYYVHAARFKTLERKEVTASSMIIENISLFRSSISASLIILLSKSL